MDSQTFRSRLVDLIQKSRKAMRLYTTMGRTVVRPGEIKSGSELADAQAAEWRTINAELVRKLSLLVEGPQSKKIVADVLALRDQLYGDFRMAEAELRSRQQELMSAAENGDFIKAALLSRDLVVVKARAQATQAAHHELDAVIKKSKIQVTSQGETSRSTEEFMRQQQTTGHESQADARREEVSTPQPSLAKVIQLRRAAQ
jgi:hypothetical protein